MLTVKLEESDYSSAWVLANRSGLSDINTDLNRELMTHRHAYACTPCSLHPTPPPAPPSNLLVNLGALMLRALYEHWPGAYINQSSSEEGGRGREGGRCGWREGDGVEGGEGGERGGCGRRCMWRTALLTVFDILFTHRDLISGTQSEQSHRLSASTCCMPCVQSSSASS